MNKKLYFYFCLCLFVCSTVLLSFGSGKVSETSANSAAASFAISGANIWDGTGQAAIRDGVIIINDGRIQAVGPRASVQIPKGATVISGEGKTLIPGLINAHGHVGMTRGLKAGPENYSEENILAHLRQYARYGVTTVLSLGSDFELIFKLRGPAGAQETPRATVFTAGRGFTGKAGYPVVLPGNAGVQREVDSVEEIRIQVEELTRQKVDMVKIWVDDHWGHYKKIRPELYRAIISEAHKRGLRVMAHLFYLEDAKSLVAAGLDGMAHSVRDQEIDDALIRSLKEKKTFAVPTLVREESTFIYAQPPAFLDDPFFGRWIAPEIVSQLKDPAYGARVKADPDFSKFPGQLKMGQKNLKKLWDAGIPVVFGSDSGPPARFQGFFEHRELELMVEAGLTPAQALQTATSNAATALHISGNFGTLTKGKRADMILLDADPLADIRNTRKINKVWIGGREVN
ncbi:MAG: amidohydrolase family protein [Acidobacteria bacterium]|nr:amidohydrolase family protein [Acidobacteriota bacterium]